MPVACRRATTKTRTTRQVPQGPALQAELEAYRKAWAAEMERKAILKRTEEGRAVAMEAGVKFGRKRSYSKGEENHVRELREQGLGYGTIATKTGLNISTVRRILS